MSYQRALDAINLRPTQWPGRAGDPGPPRLDGPGPGARSLGEPRPGLRGYLQGPGYRLDHGLAQAQAGQGCLQGRSSIDRGDGTRITEWGLSGSGWREEFLFHDVEDVLRYDPLENVPHLDMATEENARRLIQGVQDQQQEMGEACIVTGIHYTTLFQCGIMAFGWPLFLTAAGAEPDRFQRVLEGFAQITRRNLALWAAGAPAADPHSRRHRHATWHGLPSRLVPQAPVPAVRALSGATLCRSRDPRRFVSDGDYTAVLAGPGGPGLSTAF